MISVHSRLPSPTSLNCTTPVKALHEADEVARLQRRERGRRQLADPVVLQVHQVDQACVLLQCADRVLAAALHPVDIDSNRIVGASALMMSRIEVSPRFANSRWWLW